MDKATIDTEDATPPLIAEQARHEILTYPFYTIFDNMELRMQGNNLTVSGQVTQPVKKRDIGNILSHLRGVTGLQNDLEVLPTSEMDDQIRRAVARAILPRSVLCELRQPGAATDSHHCEELKRDA